MKKLPNAVISLISVVIVVGVWETFGRGVNPIFASYPSAIFAAAEEMAKSGQNNPHMPQPLHSSGVAR